MNVVAPLSAGEQRRESAELVRARIAPFAAANAADAAEIERIAARIAGRVAVITELAATADALEAPRAVVTLVRNANDELASDELGGAGRG